MKEINIKKRTEHVYGTFLGESLSKLGRHEYLKYEERRKKEAERSKIEEERRKVAEVREKRNNVIKNIFLWPLYFIVGIASAYCYLNNLIPFFTVGIIIVIGITVTLLNSRWNFILFSLLSLIGIAFFWQFKMWWWLAGMVLYFVFIIIYYECNF